MKACWIVETRYDSFATRPRPSEGIALSDPIQPDDPEVRKVCERLDEYLAQLRQSSEEQQGVVGHAMNLAHARLIQDYGSVAGYREARRDEQFKFLNQLDGVVRRLEATHLGMSWGFRIYWMYARLLMESDPTIASRYWPEVARLGKKGAGLGDTEPKQGT